jgi:hypothetical protein
LNVVLAAVLEILPQLLNASPLFKVVVLLRDEPLFVDLDLLLNLHDLPVVILTGV